MNIAYLGEHSILEYDELRILTSLGHDVFSIGSYIDPAHPIDDKRPAISGMTYHEDLAALCPDHALAKEWLPDAVLDWADTIIVAAYPVQRIARQWGHIRGKRVIWRTIGQSNPDQEWEMKQLDGLEIVRYSPNEQIAFEKEGAFAGCDALIRFGKDPSDWYGWTGDDPVVGNITQDMLGRGEFTNYRFWRDATAGLPTMPAGPRSELLPGGIGTLEYDAMRAYLRSIRVMLYTGTQPASYTLGLMEAMLTGTPVVSIGPDSMWLPDLFEGHEVATRVGRTSDEARRKLANLLAEPDRFAPERKRALDLFSNEVIAPQWAAFLGALVPA